MIDTIRFYIRKSNEILDYEHLESVLTKVKHTINIKNENDIRFSGFLKTLRFKEEKYVYSLEGSVPMYIYGDNFHTINKSQLRHFVEEISDTLRMNFFDAGISRIDITDNVIMDYPPVAYMPYLGECNYFNKADYCKHGVQYINKSRHLTFYDKHVEAKEHKSRVPEDWKGVNTLRYEYAMTKTLQNHLGFRINTISDLLNPVNAVKIPDLWWNQYQKIHKVYENISSLITITDSKSFWDHIILTGLQTHGEAKMIEHINFLRSLGIPRERRQTNRLKQDVRNYFKNAAVQEPECFLINELNDKIRDKAERNKILLLDNY